MATPALSVSCPVCDASPGFPCREYPPITGVVMAVPIHLAREFHEIVSKAEGSPNDKHEHA